MNLHFFRPPNVSGRFYNDFINIHKYIDEMRTMLELFSSNLGFDNFSLPYRNKLTKFDKFIDFFVSSGMCECTGDSLKFTCDNGDSFTISKSGITLVKSNG